MGKNFNKAKKAQKEKRIEQERKQTEYLDEKVEEFLKENDLTLGEVKRSKDIDIQVISTKEYAKIILFRKEKEKEVEKPDFLEESNIIKPNE